MLQIITPDNPVVAAQQARGEGAVIQFGVMTDTLMQQLFELQAIALPEGYYLTRGAIIALQQQVNSEALEAWLAQNNYTWRVGNRTLYDAKGIVYGVLNVSPESFYNGDQVADVTTMVARAGDMLANGADVIEVGGQTTKPGYVAAGLELSPTAEIDRIAPVIAGIQQQYPEAIIAIDTYKYDVMVKAVELGVHIINDVNGFTDDERKLPFLAQHEVGLLTMWNPRGVQVQALITEMQAWFTDNLAAIEAAGISLDRVALDPGVGYAKNSDVRQDLAMMNTIGHLQRFVRPVMTAVANKGWAKFLLDLPKYERADVSLIAAHDMFMRGARILRVHDVRSAKQMVQVTSAISESYWTTSIDR
jgi:dihydropteroate synthase